MRRLLCSLGTLAVALALAVPTFAQANPRGTAKLTLKRQTISVEYGRPSLKGRTVQDLIGQVKPGGFWRLGADKSTTFSTGLDLAFGDVTIPKGEYSLWMRREVDNSWKLVFNKEHGQWGTQHDPAQDFAAVGIQETKATTPVEEFTISLSKAADGGQLSAEWGEMVLSTEFKTK